MQAVVEQAVDALNGCTNVFVKPSDVGGDVVGGHAAVVQILEKLKTDAAKVGVLGGDATAEEAKGMLDVVQQSLAAACNTLHTFTDGAGQTLKEELKQSASRLKDACVELARALLAADVSAAVKPAVGDVWAQSDAIKKAPLDNKTALFKKIAAVTRVLKDTLREVEELEQENNNVNGTIEEEEDEEGEEAGAAGANGHAAGNGNGGVVEGFGPDDEDILDFAAGPMSGKDVAVVQAAQGLLEVGVRTLTTLARPLLTSPSIAGDEVEGWESLVWHTKALQRGAEDLGAALYPPQDLEEVSGAAEGFVISCECMLSEVPEAHASALSEALQALEVQLEAAQQRLQAAVGDGALNQPDGSNDDEDNE